MSSYTIPPDTGLNFVPQRLKLHQSLITRRTAAWNEATGNGNKALQQPRTDFDILGLGEQLLNRGYEGGVILCGKTSRIFLEDRNNQLHPSKTTPMLKNNHMKS